MPATTPIQFAAQSYQARSPNVSTERLLNLYLEKNPSGAKSSVTLYGRPGLRRWTTVGDGPIRGMLDLVANLYVVSGSKLFAVNHAKTATEIGSIGGNGNVHMTKNATHVAIATNGPAYAANKSGVVELPRANLNSATGQDGFGIFTQAGTQKIWATPVDDMTTIEGLSFGTADAQPGLVVGCISDHLQIAVFGEDHTEFWNNAGTSPFPFARMESGFIEVGCAASGSITKANNRVLWLGHDLAMHAAAGYESAEISNPSIQRLIAARAAPESCWSFAYHQEGHTFLVANFSDMTLCYDLLTGLWHERSSYGVGRWRANCYANPWRMHLVGDCVDGRIHELDLDYYTDDGDPITAQAVAPPVSGNGVRLAFGELVVDAETGVGLATGQGSDPTAMLDWSDDGGHTWSNVHHKSMGATGKYKHEIAWTRLGSARERHFRLTITDPVKRAILGARVRVEGR